MKKKAIAYLRTGEQSQAISSTEFYRQSQAIAKYAETAEYTIAKEYHESFTGIESLRPEFKKAILELSGNGCKTIIVESLGVLAHDRSTQFQIVAYIASKDLKLICSDTEQDVTEFMKADPVMRNMIQIQVMFAGIEKSLVVNDQLKSKEKKRSEHIQPEDNKPFGYYSGEREALKRIRELRRKKPDHKRSSVRAIATILNIEGYQTKHGGQWDHKSVLNIVKRARRGGSWSSPSVHGPSENRIPKALPPKDFSNS